MRRRPLLLAALAGSVAASPMDAARKAFAGGRPLQRGRVRLDIAPLVENGASVPIRLWIEAVRARRLALLAPGNPQPEVIECEFSSDCPRAEVSTRIRLQRSQTLLALAELEDGSCWEQSFQVLVTLAACVEGE